MEIIPPALKGAGLPVYEVRLRHGREPESSLPRHIAVLCDGNRRWARDAGYDDVATATGWARQDRRDAAVVRRGRHRDGDRVPVVNGESAARPGELADLIEIITDFVEEICAPVNHWSVRAVGDLGLIGEDQARRVRDAVDTASAAASTGCFHVNLAVGYGGRQEDRQRGPLAAGQTGGQRRDGPDDRGR